ncbi:imidazoleglycerol-phosphate dehydratase HisB [bacterium]|nr:imidazoleglycerol-phosphate dehydratase HisB [bacterium]
MGRNVTVSRKTNETKIDISLDLDGSGKADIDTGIPFFDHMLSAFCVHGFFDLKLKAVGDLEVDYHHTVEDIGIVLGQALAKTLEKKEQIVRFGNSTVPMDEALSKVTIDLSNRPYLVYNYPENVKVKGKFEIALAKEFFQSISIQGAFNLHINCEYGINEHHILESIFKALGKSLHMATRIDQNICSTLSTKGIL